LILDRDATGEPVVWLPSGLCAGVHPAVALTDLYLELLPLEVAGYSPLGKNEATVVYEHLGPNSGLAALPYLINWTGNLGVDVDLRDGVTRTAVPVGRMGVELQASAYRLRARQAEDFERLQRWAAEIQRENDRISVLLQSLTGHCGPSDRAGWSRWCAERRRYTVAPPPLSRRITVIEYAPVSVSDRPGRVGQFRWDPLVGYFAR
jgi:hypothetical protein